MSQVFSLGSSLSFLIAFIFVLEQQETVLGAWPVHHYGIATTTENLNLSTTEVRWGTQILL